MSIFSILKSDSFSSTLQSLSGKAMEVLAEYGLTGPQIAQTIAG